MAASKITLGHLKSVLSEEGLLEGRDYAVAADGRGNLQLAVTVAPDGFYLPEELLTHDPDPIEVDRVLEAQEGSKSTRDGVRFELAVKSFRKALYADEELNWIMTHSHPYIAPSSRNRDDDIWQRIQGELALENFEEQLRTDFY